MKRALGKGPADGRGGAASAEGQGPPQGLTFARVSGQLAVLEEQVDDRLDRLTAQVAVLEQQLQGGLLEMDEFGQHSQVAASGHTAPPVAGRRQQRRQGRRTGGGAMDAALRNQVTAAIGSPVRHGRDSPVRASDPADPAWAHLLGDVRALNALALEQFASAVAQGAARAVAQAGVAESVGRGEPGEEPAAKARRVTEGAAAKGPGAAAAVARGPGAAAAVAKGPGAAAAAAEGPGAAAAPACAARGAGARCGDGMALLDEQAASVWRGALCPSWEVVEAAPRAECEGGAEAARYGAGRALRRSFVAKSFAAALAWFTAVADVAERANHHPDLHLTDYRTVTVQIRTIDAGGLTVTDFRLAQLLDALPVEYSPKWLKQSSAQLSGLRAGLVAKDASADEPAAVLVQHDGNLGSAVLAAKGAGAD
jgi:pterin-4a-carbinolamine dehydratase